MTVSSPYSAKTPLQRKKLSLTKALNRIQNPLHSCTWEGKDGVREDIRFFGSSEDAPFTKVELIQYIPSDMDFQNTDEK
ncbi:hypothetical protein, partial [Faecalibaculum rodentium]